MAYQHTEDNFIAR